MPVAPRSALGIILDAGQLWSSFRGGGGHQTPNRSHHTTRRARVDLFPRLLNQHTPRTRFHRGTCRWPSFDCCLAISIRVGDPNFEGAQGAFRSGKYKYVSNEYCSGWYTFSRYALAVDELTNTTMVCDGSPCSSCALLHCSSYYYGDYLFDLEDDPREEKNLIEVHPEVRCCCCCCVFGRQRFRGLNKRCSHLLFLVDDLSVLSSVDALVSLF